MVTNIIERIGHMPPIPIDLPPRLAVLIIGPSHSSCAGYMVSIQQRRWVPVSDKLIEEGGISSGSLVLKEVSRRAIVQRIGICDQIWDGCCASAFHGNTLQNEWLSINMSLLCH